MNGIIVLNKPKGMTSFSVVNTLHKLTKEKAGHAGTLDPMAEGVLVVLLGKATKSAKKFESSEKTYDAEITFGVETDSLDATGKVTKTHDVNITEEQLKEAIKNYIGEIDQIPPMVSAIHHNGRRLYELARLGISVDREPRRVTISEINLRSFSGKSAEISVICSKGTYIRSLCADIGTDLGCGAHMSKLTRTRSGDFNLSDSISLEDAIKLHNTGELEARICPI
jgi:tRNA pseudouridine55 synthase